MVDRVSLLTSLVNNGERALLEQEAIRKGLDGALAPLILATSFDAARKPLIQDAARYSGLGCFGVPELSRLVNVFVREADVGGGR